MRIFKTRAFVRFARKERIEDAALCDAIDRAERGQIDADLGGQVIKWPSHQVAKSSSGQVIKQRVARPGQGRSGGYRTVVAYRTATRSVFLHGFAKSDQDNISVDELKQLRKAAAEILEWSDDQVAELIEAGKWTEVHCDD